jgi:hypothetical protein
MSERSEGRMDWEVGTPEKVGAVAKFIAEVRAGLASATHADAVATDAEKAAAFDCVRDAYIAFTAAVDAEKAQD